MKAVFTDKLPKHKVNSKVTKTQIIFHCPICQLKRVINRKNGIMRIVNPGEFGVLHEGFTVPMEVSLS